MPTPTRERLNLSKTTCNIRLGKGLAKNGLESVTSPNADTHKNLRTKEQKNLLISPSNGNICYLKKVKTKKLTHTEEVFKTQKHCMPVCVCVMQLRKKALRRRIKQGEEQFAANQKKREEHKKLEIYKLI